MPFVFPYALVFWATYIWAVLPEFGIVKRAPREKIAGMRAKRDLMR